MPLEIGMVGTGAFAARMAQAIASSPDVTLSGVCSHDPARAEAFCKAHGGAPYTDVAEMAKAIGAVYVANATGQHDTASIAAMRAGAAVLCEKPMAVDAARTQAVLDAAKETGRLFVEGYWTCHLPAWQAAKARLADGRIGEAVHLRADFSHPTTREDNPRVWSEDDGVLRDRGVYPVCLALWLLGPAKLKDASVTRQDGVDVEAALDLIHDNGARSRLTTSLLARHGNRAVLEGTSGAVSIPEPLLGAQHVRGGKADAEGPATQNKLVRKALTLKGQVRAEKHPYGADQYHPQFAHFAKLVRDGAIESAVVPHDLSLGIAKIIEEARAA